MPRTTLTVLQPTDAGVVLTRTAGDSVNNHDFPNNGATLLVVDNGGLSSINVTLNFAADKYGRTGSKIVAVAAGTEKVIGPFIPDLYNHDGKVQFDLSDDDTVTVAAVNAQR